MILFDFDGVLVDSLNEVTVNTYSLVTNRVFTSLDEVPESYVTLFARYRYLVQPAGDFVPFAKWCLQASCADLESGLDTHSFQTLVQAERTPLKERTKLFFEMRERRVKLDEKRWLSLHEPYQPLWNFLAQQPTGKIVILTNKNRDAVLLLGKHYGMNFESENIYSADGGTTKLENFAVIERRFGKQLFHFIDDSVLNLLEMQRAFSPLQLRPVLARWGYVGPDDENRANQHRIDSWSQEDLIKFCLSG